jgi:hypothetical protein
MCDGEKQKNYSWQHFGLKKISFIIKHFQTLKQSIPHGINHIIGLKHTITKSLNISNHFQYMNKFDKILYNFILLFDGKMVDLLFHDSIMMDQITKHEHHLFL